MVPRAWCLVPMGLCLVLFGQPASAQTKEPLPWFAIDLHAAMVGLPTAEGWIPVVSSDTPVPGRAWGVSGGATAYPLRLGIVTFGVGASWSAATGKGESLTIPSGSGATATPRTTPLVRTGVMHVTPQLSINFGHKLGWSYLSAGLGRTRVESRADAVGATPEVVIPAAWNQALNFGGGARWFMKRRLGAGFDVRFVKLGSRGASATLPSARRTQMITFSAGISIQ
jgi:hypothetical protein